MIDPSVLAAIDALIGEKGEELTLGLFSNDIVPDLLAGTSQFVEPTFDGYAAVEGQFWDGPEENAAGVPVLTAPPFVWTKGADKTKAQFVRGWWLKIGVGPAASLVGCGRFATPRSMRVVGDQTSVQAVVAVTAGGDQGIDSIMLSAFADASTGARHMARHSFRGLRRQMLNKLRNAINSTGRHDQKAADKAEKEGTLESLFNDSPAVSEALAVLLARIEDALVQTG